MIYNWKKKREPAKPHKFFVFFFYFFYSSLLVVSEVETKWRSSDIFEMDAKIDINLKCPTKGTLKVSYPGIYNGNV